MFFKSAVSALASIDFYSPQHALTLYLSSVSTAKSILNIITGTVVFATSGEFGLQLIVQIALNYVIANAPFGTGAHVGRYRGDTKMGRTCRHTLTAAGREEKVLYKVKNHCPPS